MRFHLSCMYLDITYLIVRCSERLEIDCAKLDVCS